MTTKESMAAKLADIKAAPAKKAPTKKATGAKTTGKTNGSVKKTSVKTPAKKSFAKETVVKSGGSKTAKESSGGRKYSPDASRNVEREMHEMHQGQLTIGKSGKKVTNPKQAIAIALSEARRAGEKVPPNPNDPKK